MLKNKKSQLTDRLIEGPKSIKSSIVKHFASLGAAVVSVVRHSVW